MIDGISEIIKMFEERRGPKWARAVLYVAVAAVVVLSLNIVFTMGIIPLTEWTAKLIAHWRTQEGSAHTEWLSADFKKKAGDYLFGAFIAVTVYIGIGRLFFYIWTRSITKRILRLIDRLRETEVEARGVYLMVYDLIKDARAQGLQIRDLKEMPNMEYDLDEIAVLLGETPSERAAKKAKRRRLKGSE